MKTKEEIVEEVETELIDIEDYVDAVEECIDKIRYLLEEL